MKKQLTVKSFIVDIRPGSKYSSDERNKIFSSQIRYFQKLLFQVLKYMSHAPSCLTCLCTLRTFVPYAPSCITWAIYVLCTPYLCALNSSFLDKFVVYQKLSVFQKLLKAIQILLFLCGSKKQPSFKLFNRGNLLSIFTT